jgi:hypothetical protein
MHIGWLKCILEVILPQQFRDHAETEISRKPPLRIASTVRRHNKKQKNKENMENILNITIPLILTGLAFITYKHPDIARKLLKILLYSTSIIYILSSAYYLGRLHQYYDIKLPYTPDKTKIDNIFEIQKDFNAGLFNSIYIYFGLTVAVITIFYLLSGLFEKARNPDS